MATLLLCALPSIIASAALAVPCHWGDAAVCRSRHPRFLMSISPDPAPLPLVEDLSGDGGVLMRRAVGSSPTAGGEYARPSTYARVHYRATLEGGVVLADSRSGAGEALELRVGAQPSEGVPGWDIALPRMRVGERVVLVCEPRYAFGEAGVQPHIPPMATVRFDLELLGVRDLLSSNNTETVDFLKKYAHVMAANEISKITLEVQAEAEAEAEASAKADAFFAAEARAVSNVAAESVVDVDVGPGTPTDAASREGTGSAAAAREVIPGMDGAVQAPMPTTPAAASSDGATPAAATTPAGRGWVPSATRIEASHPAGHSWRETDAEIELRAPLPPEVANAKDVRVEIGARSLRIAVLGEEWPALSGRLTGRLAVEESSWSFLPAGEEGEAAVLQLDLMKKVWASEHEPLWGYVLESERASASGQRAQAGGGGGDSGGGSCDGDICGTVTVISTDSAAGTTYQLALTLSGNAANAYTIYGTEDSPLSIPPSYQEGAPFGANTGGVNPAFLSIMATAAYDGWLTVGITEGDTAGALGSVGLDWDMWTTEAGLDSVDGAVFWMNPDGAPAGDTIVAQFTTAPGWTATFGAQGRSTSGDDWAVNGLSFSA